MATDPAPTFGARLRSARLAAGLTQEALAERAGLSVRAISDLERGARRLPHPHTVRRLARALGLGAAERARLEAAVPRRRRLATAAGAVPPLPAALTRLVGRERELAEVGRLLGEARLLTLTGAGGVGKTRLALAAARALAPSLAGGAAWVELAPLADPALVPHAVAAAVGARETPGQPLPDALLAALRDRPRLLVLDNAEHLVDAAARLAEALLAGCPRLVILVTSREPLAVPAEVAWRLPSLALPAPGDAARPAALAAVPAVALFLDRARAARPDFALTAENAAAVAEVCRRLDGIPLALELAAARVPALAPAEIAARLDDRFRLLTGGGRTAPARQRTLRAAVDWSYELLAERERALLRRLAVFAGGWTLDAAEAVGAGDGLDGAEVLDLLAGLVDRSLAQAEPRPDGATRYRLLETVRAYAAERLAEAGEAAAARDRHAAWGLALAERAEPSLAGPEDAAWFDRLEAEHDNLRAALGWLRESGAHASALRLATALTAFWLLHERLSEGRAWLTDVLALDVGRGAVDAPALRLARAKAMHGLGQLATAQGDLAVARAQFEVVLPFFRDVGDRWQVAHTASWLGIVAKEQGDAAAAGRWGEESLAIWRGLGDRLATCWALRILGGLAGDQGEYTRAGRLLAEGLALARAVGSPHARGDMLMELGRLAYRQGEYVAARSHLDESLACYRAVGADATAAWALAHLGHLDIAEGQHARARARLAAALTSRAEATSRPLLALSLTGFARLAAAGARPERAARLAGAAAALGEAIGAPPRPVAAAELARGVAPARAALGAGAWAAAWAAGRALTPDQAVAEALGEADAELAPPAAAGRDPAGLTRREAEVLRLLAAGATDPAIAAALSISVNTVHKHVASILAKTGAANRTAAAAAALRRGLR